MTVPTVTSKQRSSLRALAHPLKPVVHVGQKGVTDGVLREVDQALGDHELIKVRLDGEREERREMARWLAAETGADLVHEVGKVIALFRPHPDAEQRTIRV